MPPGSGPGSRWPPGAGGLVNQHFGHAREFLVYQVTRDGARLLGTRTMDRYCRGGEGEEDALAGVLRALADCQAVLVAKVGHCPRGQLAAAGIEPVVEQAHQPIEASALAGAGPPRGGGAAGQRGGLEVTPACASGWQHQLPAYPGGTASQSAQQASAHPPRRT